jgi:trypsin
MLRKSILTTAILMSASVFAESTGPQIISLRLSETIRIVGGEEIEPHSKPYQASIQSIDGSHFCGGSIIGEDLILTAAHCMEGVDGDSPNMLVRVGAHSLTDGSGEAIKVITTYTNQEYPSLSKDVAVLKLEKKITNKDTAIIKLANQSFFTDNIKEKSPLVVSGWGTLSSNGQMPDKLMAVTVPFVTNEVCNSAEAYGGQVQDTEICAGIKEGGKDSCQGDSGGPLVFTHNNEFYQVGVVSWGEGCAEANKYGVYGNVPALKSWIDSAMAGNEPASGLAGGDNNGDDGDTGGETGEESFMAFQETISYSVDEEQLAFVLDVPEGMNVIYISTRGGEGDVDIEAEFSATDSDEEDYYYDDDFDIPFDYYVSQNEGNDEVIMIQFPQGGEWIIKFSDFMNYENVELTVFAH